MKILILLLTESHTSLKVSLYSFIHLLINLEEPRDSPEGLILQSCALNRYTCDPRWVQITQMAEPPSRGYYHTTNDSILSDWNFLLICLDVFDIVLSDGTRKLKCVLGTDMYEQLIPKRILFGKPIVKVLDWRVFCLVSYSTYLSFSLLSDVRMKESRVQKYL